MAHPNPSPKEWLLLCWKSRVTTADLPPEQLSVPLQAQQSLPTLSLLPLPSLPSPLLGVTAHDADTIRQNPRPGGHSSTRARWDTAEEHNSLKIDSHK